MISLLDRKLTCAIVALFVIAVLGACSNKPEAEEEIMQAGIDALYARNNPNAAMEQFRKVLKRNPDHYGATFQLATALDRAGKPTEARPLWEKMLKMAEAADDKETADLVRARLSSTGASEEEMMQAGINALYARNNPSAAVEQFRRVLKRNPDHYGATFQLAMALESGGRAAEARPLWEKMLRMAEAAGDKETIKTAQERLARRGR